MAEYTNETNEWLESRLETLRKRYYDAVQEVADVMNKFYSVREEIQSVLDEMKTRGMIIETDVGWSHHLQMSNYSFWNRELKFFELFNQDAQRTKRTVYKGVVIDKSPSSGSYFLDPQEPDGTIFFYLPGIDIVGDLSMTGTIPLTTTPAIATAISTQPTQAQIDAVGLQFPNYQGILTNWPIVISSSDLVTNRISSDFGNTRDGHFHTGVDIKPDRKLPQDVGSIVSSGKGFVIVNNLTSQGISQIIIKHVKNDGTDIFNLPGFGDVNLYTRYLHCKNILNVVQVNAGDKIADIGSVGADNPHLHFDVMIIPVALGLFDLQKVSYLNPLRFFRQPSQTKTGDIANNESVDTSLSKTYSMEKITSQGQNLVSSDGSSINIAQASNTSTDNGTPDNTQTSNPFIVQLNKTNAPFFRRVFPIRNGEVNTTVDRGSMIYVSFENPNALTNPVYMGDVFYNPTSERGFNIGSPPGADSPSAWTNLERLDRRIVQLQKYDADDVRSNPYGSETILTSKQGRFSDPELYNVVGRDGSRPSFDLDSASDGLLSNEDYSNIKTKLNLIAESNFKDKVHKFDNNSSYNIKKSDYQINSARKILINDAIEIDNFAKENYNINSKHATINVDGLMIGHDPQDFLVLGHKLIDALKNISLAIKQLQFYPNLIVGTETQLDQAINDLSNIISVNHKIDK